MDRFPVFFLIVLVVALSGCASASPGENGRLRVVATTSILGDVVGAVAGDGVQLTVLLPVGTDPHTFDPTPRDVAAVADADLIFINGLGLEAFMQPLLANAGGDAEVVSVSEGVETVAFAGEQDHEHEDEDEHGEADPHVWMDPANVKLWVDSIAGALRAQDPGNAEKYRASAEAYKRELDELHAWIMAQVETIPEARRVLVTDHEALAYFARRYGFALIGAVIPGFSTLSEPSAQALAALEQAIAQYDVPAIFVGTTVNPNLAERVAQDTGTQVVPLYTGSLSVADGPAASYIEMMRYDVTQIVQALK